MKIKSMLLGGAAVIMLAGAGGCSSLGNLNTDALLSAGSKVTQAMTLTDEAMAEYISQYVTQLDAENTVLPSSNAYSKRLANLTSGITSVEGIPLNFKVYQTSDVNAFACADGSVRVYSGLMDIMTDDEVLGVIGHEIGHVAHKDTKNAFKQALMNSAILDGLSSAGGTIAVLSQSQLAQLGDQAMSAKFSRKQENNADSYGYEFLKSHGKNPWAMVHSFQKLQQLEQQAGSTATSGMMQLFSTHPDIADRIETMKKRCEKDGIAESANK